MFDFEYAVGIAMPSRPPKKSPGDPKLLAQPFLSHDFLASMEYSVRGRLYLTSTEKYLLPDPGRTYLLYIKFIVTTNSHIRPQTQENRLSRPLWHT